MLVNDAVRFINKIGETVARDDYCVEVAIKCSIHHYRLII